MLDLHIAPMFAKMFRDQSAMAVVRFVLAAQQTATIEQFGCNRLFNFPGREQFAKVALVGGPIAIDFLVAIEHFLRRCQV